MSGSMAGPFHLTDLWSEKGRSVKKTHGGKEFRLFKRAHVNPQDSKEEANYKFDNMAGAPSDEQAISFTGLWA